MKTLYLTSPFLLFFYVMLPLSLLCVGLDYTLFNFRLREMFLSDADGLAYWSFFFTLPHIIGSHVTMMDRDYYPHYKKLLASSIPICILLGVAVPLYLGHMALFIIISIYNMHHVLMQQYGIGLMLLSRRPDFDFKCWKWLSFSGLLMLYFLIFAENYFTPETRRYTLLFITACIVVSTFFVLRLLKKIDPKTSWAGRWYFYATVLTGYVCFALYLAGYPLLTVLIPRFLHDGTAFTVYAVHDQNRNGDVRHNYVYRALSFVPIKPVYLAVPLSMAVGMTLGWLQLDYEPVYYFNFAIVFLHYFTEAHIWKAGSPHRENLPIIK